VLTPLDMIFAVGGWVSLLTYIVVNCYFFSGLKKEVLKQIDDANQVKGALNKCLDRNIALEEILEEVKRVFRKGSKHYHWETIDEDTSSERGES